MSISKADYLSTLAYFRKRMLAEVAGGYVAQEADKSLMSTTEHNQLAEIVKNGGQASEDVSQSDIDTIFTDTSDTSSN